ncbi:MAG: hypothetical protein ACTJF0_07050 [Psychroflexus halocasei]
MNIYITLDYELFFGKHSGSVENCIIKPTEALLKIVNPLKIKFTCFVDVGYLVKLEEQKEKYTQLKKDYQKITAQIKNLANQGHGMELHIHPHWEDSHFNGKEWVFDTSRYKLADFSSDKVHEIVTKYTKTLTKISGQAPKAYRAGGWSAQPFKEIGKALLKNNVRIDSTVFPKGYYNSSAQYYDFRKVAQFNTDYCFSEDLVKENPEGDFKEIPISSYKVSPFFFWKFAYHKLKKQSQHRAFGDGSAIAKTKKDTFRLMLAPSHSVVSIDGYKASFIQEAYYWYKKNTKSMANFVLIGHPKAFTPYALKKLDEFLKTSHKNNHFKTFQD